MGDTEVGCSEHTLVLVAHGTRTPAGVRTIAELSAAGSARVGPVHTAFVDVLGPSPADVLTTAPNPAIVVPAFLASGFHVHTDLPAHVADSGHRDTTVTPALGPDPQLAAVMRERLQHADWRPGDAVMMAAAGSSDAIAQSELRSAAMMLVDLIGEVHLAHLAHIATGTPKVADVVTRLRASGARRVVIALHLLAHGFFHARLAQCTADAVAAPLGVHPRVVDLVSARFAAAMTTPRARTDRSAEQMRSRQHPWWGLTAAPAARLST